MTNGRGPRGAFTGPCVSPGKLRHPRCVPTACRLGTSVSPVCKAEAGVGPRRAAWLRYVPPSKKPRRAGFFVGETWEGAGRPRYLLPIMSPVCRLRAGRTGIDVRSARSGQGGHRVGIRKDSGQRRGAVQKRAGARLRSRSSSGQADKIAVVFMLENSCDVPTTQPESVALTAFRKKMQPPTHPSLHFRLL